MCLLNTFTHFIILLFENKFRTCFLYLKYAIANALPDVETVTWNERYFAITAISWTKIADLEVGQERYYTRPEHVWNAENVGQVDGN